MTDNNIQRLKAHKEALRKKQRELSYAEKIEMLDRLHENRLWIKKNPPKKISP